MNHHDSKTCLNDSAGKKHTVQFYNTIAVFFEWEIIFTYIAIGSIGVNAVASSGAFGLLNWLPAFFVISQFVCCNVSAIACWSLPKFAYSPRSGWVAARKQIYLFHSLNLFAPNLVIIGESLNHRIEFLTFAFLFNSEIQTVFFGRFLPLVWKAI